MNTAVHDPLGVGRVDPVDEQAVFRSAVRAWFVAVQASDIDRWTFWALTGFVSYGVLPALVVRLRDGPTISRVWVLRRDKQDIGHTRRRLASFRRARPSRWISTVS